MEKLRRARKTQVSDEKIQLLLSLTFLEKEQHTGEDPSSISRSAPFHNYDRQVMSGINNDLDSLGTGDLGSNIPEFMEIMPDSNLPPFEDMTFSEYTEQFQNDFPISSVPSRPGSQYGADMTSTTVSVGPSVITQGTEAIFNTQYADASNYQPGSPKSSPKVISPKSAIALGNVGDTYEDENTTSDNPSKPLDFPYY